MKSEEKATTCNMQTIKLCCCCFFHFDWNGTTTVSCKCLVQQANRMVSYLRSIVAFVTSRLHTYARRTSISFFRWFYIDTFTSTIPTEKLPIYLCAQSLLRTLVHTHSSVSPVAWQPPSETSEIKPFTWRLWPKKKRACLHRYIYGHKLASAAILRISYRS